MSIFGNKGRFSQRIKKAYVKNKKKEEPLIEDGSTIYHNFLKVTAAIPLMIYDNLRTEDSLNGDFQNNNYNIDNQNSINSNNDKSLVSNNTVNINIDRSLINNSSIKKDNNIIQSLKQKKEIINNIDVSLIKKKQQNFFSNNIQNEDIKNKNINILENNDAKILEKKIIDLIKKQLIKTVNELEILQSDLYILSEVNNDEKTLRKCQENLDEVKKILCKIDILKKKYDFLKDDFDFSYMLEYDDKPLIDSIIELKNKFSYNELRATSVDYKLLDVYKYLYLRIDQIEEDTSNFEIEKEKQLELLKERDINFDKLKNDIYNVEKTNDEYLRFIANQNEFLNRINNDVSKINSYESVHYKLKGFNRLLLNSFKYIGLLTLNPLKGIIPSIATETLITKNVVSNLFNNLEWEKNSKMIYTATNYADVINNAIDDLDYTGRIVDTTLEDIVKLKIKYNENFKKYQGDFYEYEQVIYKINDMENKILGNKIKIEMMKKKMLENERKNEKKLQLVKELNDDRKV